MSAAPLLTARSESSCASLSQESFISGSFLSRPCEGKKKRPSFQRVQDAAASTQVTSNTADPCAAHQVSSLQGCEVKGKEKKHQNLAERRPKMQNSHWTRGEVLSQQPSPCCVLAYQTEQKFPEGNACSN